MIVTPYFAKLTGIKFGKICLSPPSRCRGVHGVVKTQTKDYAKSVYCTTSHKGVADPKSLVNVEKNNKIPEGESNP